MVPAVLEFQFQKEEELFMKQELVYTNGAAHKPKKVFDPCCAQLQLMFLCTIKVQLLGSKYLFWYLKKIYWNILSVMCCGGQSADPQILTMNIWSPVKWLPLVFGLNSLWWEKEHRALPALQRQNSHMRSCTAAFSLHEGAGDLQGWAWLTITAKTEIAYFRRPGLIQHYELWWNEISRLFF